jgi:hypothetical protein
LLRNTRLSNPVGSIYLSLANAAFLVLIVIIKQTRRREGGLGDGVIRRNWKGREYEIVGLNGIFYGLIEETS